MLKMAICVPKSCSNIEVKNAILAASGQKMSLLNATIHVEVPERLCSTLEPIELSSLDISFL